MVENYERNHWLDLISINNVLSRIPFQLLARRNALLQSVLEHFQGNQSSAIHCCIFFFTKLYPSSLYPLPYRNWARLRVSLRILNPTNISSFTIAETKSCNTWVAGYPNIPWFAPFLRGVFSYCRLFLSAQTIPIHQSQVMPLLRVSLTKPQSKVTEFYQPCKYQVRVGHNCRLPPDPQNRVRLPFEGMCHCAAHRRHTSGCCLVVKRWCNNLPTIWVTFL